MTDKPSAMPIIGLRQPWAWVQPKSVAEIKQRLLEARDFKVPERERENMCSVAHGEIVRLERDLRAAQEALVFWKKQATEEREQAVEQLSTLKAKIEAAWKELPTSIGDLKWPCNWRPEGALAEQLYDFATQLIGRFQDLRAAATARIAELTATLKASHEGAECLSRIATHQRERAEQAEAARGTLISYTENGETKWTPLGEQIRRLEAGRNEWRKALMGLTAGGSEFTSPQPCVDYVRAVRTSQNETIVKFKAERDAAREIRLSDYVNAADISAADAPHKVVEKLQSAIDQAIRAIKDGKK